jgi:hypothetical protein
MTMSTIDDTIAALQTKLKQAKERKQQIESRKRTLQQKQERADDTRRKILVGALILAKVERGEWPREKLMAMLDTELSRADDRALFDLAPRPGTI